MAARPSGSFTSAITSLFSRWYDQNAYSQVNHDINNNFPLSAASADDSTSIHMLSADTDNVVRLDRANLMGGREPVTFSLNAAGTMSTQVLFIANRAMVLTDIFEIHSTAETATGTCTLQITKDASGTAPGSGTSLLTATIDLKGTANTVATGSLLAVSGTGQPNAGITLAAGDRITAVIGGTATVTALAGVVLTIWAAPGFKETPAIYQMKANGSIATQNFFQANRDFRITGVRAVWSAAGTDAGTVTIDVTHETSTTAAGSGSSILSAALSVKTTANTPAAPALTATTSRLTMRAGDRLTMKLAGTPTALAGLVVIVYMESLSRTGYIGQVDAGYSLLANGSLATQGFLIADRDYEVVDFGAVEGTAGSDGGAVTLDCTIDKGAVAPGAGSSCLAGTYSLKTTAYTSTWPGITTARRSRLASRGDLISVKYTGTLTSLAGVTAGISLLPR